MESITQGHYYRKQLACKSGVIAWSHKSRFNLGLRLIGSPVRKLLDYGCGDGTFLALAAEHVEQGYGADVAADQIDDCRTRISACSNLHFCAVRELGTPIHAGAYDVVTCMETLEHCIAPVVEIVLNDLARLVSPDGHIVISVPIETGPTFLLKWFIRKAAAWRGLSDYRYYESYSLRQALRMLFAGSSTVVERPLYGDPEAPSHSHYGFNWRSLRERVQAHLVIERTHFSPLGFFGGWVSSQVWFVCRPRQRSTPTA
jgi:SAM-dependent methyltransferase